jgi:hypothetical protein
MSQNNLTPIRRITHSVKHHFFGYYDKCPWSINGRMLLTMEVDFNDRFPVNDTAGLGIIDLGNHREIDIIGHTRAWNWQQGAMLQWLSSNPNSIIYNDRIDQEFVSVKLSITNGKKEILPRPIAALSHSGKTALSLNFARLYNTRRDYGYAGLSDPGEIQLYPKNDGIYSLDLNSGQYRLIITIDQVAAYEPETSPRGVRHWINHLAYNPNDTRFCFLHRFENPHSQGFGTRLFTANLDGSDLRCLWNNHISHFDWCDNDHILAWAVKKSSSTNASRTKANALRFLKQYKWLYRRLKMSSFLRSNIYGGAFFLFHDTVNKNNQPKIIGKNILTEDGHCTYSPDRKWIILDTYPDLHNNRHLLLYNIEKQKYTNIGGFFSPPNLTNELRCDLHPRWSRDGKQICIDSAHEGSRQVYIVDISRLVK